MDCPRARSSYEDVMITINKNNDIIIGEAKYSDVFVCDKRGNLKHKFERKNVWLWNLSISNKNEIMVASEDERAVQIYSKEGNLKSTIKLPEGHEIRGVAFHFAFSKIIVLTYVEKKDSYFLLSFTEEDELETTTYFCEKADHGIPKITSYPSGGVAVVTRKIVTFI